MAAIEPNWQALLVFLVAWLAGCIGLIYLSGNLPLKAAPETARVGFGPALIWTNLAVLVVLTVLSLGFAVSQLRWTSLIVGGGGVFLFAPFIVQDLPRSLKDTQVGLAVLLGCLLAAVMLVYIASNR
ncbi:MAG: hypothetical protein ACI89J_000325 [Hyphomicrobiaceae bacterium]